MKIFFCDLRNWYADIKRGYKIYFLWEKQKIFPGVYTGKHFGNSLIKRL
jgi:hypothetical protein